MSDDIKARLDAARKAKEAKATAAREAAELHEVELFELESRLEKEHGSRGKDFEIVETVEGPIAVKLGEGVLHTRFQGAKDINETTIHDYVFPCVVHPAKEAYLAIVGRRPGVALRCALALSALYGTKAGDDAGKF